MRPATIFMSDVMIHIFSSLLIYDCRSCCLGAAAAFLPRFSSTDQGWFSKISNSLMVRKIEPGKDSHSRLLTDSQAIYEMQSE